MKKSTITNAALLILSIYIIIFYMIGIEAIQIIHIPFSFSFIFLIIFIFAYILYEYGIQVKMIIGILPFVLFNSLYFIRYTGEILFIVYQIFYVLMFLLLAQLNFEKKHLKVLMISVLPLTIFTLYLATQYNNEFTLSVNIPFYNGNPNSNTIGAFGYLLAYFPLIYFADRNKKYSQVAMIFFISIAFATVLSSGTRSMLAVMLVSLSIIIFWKYIIKNKLMFNLFFGVVVLIVFSVIAIYPNLDTLLNNFDYWNELISSFTGKRILSGRNVLWQYALQLISQKLFFGYGSATSLTNFFFSQLESHNLYLEIALQVGIMGLTFFIWGLWTIWNYFWKNRHNKKTIISASYFIGIIIYQTFEVSLFQAGFERGVLPWIIIGIGVSFNELNNTESLEDQFL